MTDSEAVNASIMEADAALDSICKHLRERQKEVERLRGVIVKERADYERKVNEKDTLMHLHNELRAERDAIQNRLSQIEQRGKKLLPTVGAGVEVYAILRSAVRTSALRFPLALREKSRLFEAVVHAMEEGKEVEILRDGHGAIKGAAYHEAESDTVKAPEISPEYAKKTVKETFGDTLYEAFMRGARAEIIGELQAKDEERFPR